MLSEQEKEDALVEASELIDKIEFSLRNIVAGVEAKRILAKIAKQFTVKD